ncbi:AraC family transcriptional regulator [Algibacillus agarilyticus]|uniref:AraC family transcriptional regulator n=1 Tax=Algibacillus agarilyticus TaxID=2234133 RepID=UPI000DCFE4DB|nr:AraC family transcriptional regulator [Algibacillus agarilyticus]
MNWFERDDDILLCRQFTVALVDLAKQSGIHPDKILKGTRCFYNDLIKPEYCISVQALLVIIDNVNKLSTRQDLSFLLGRKFFPSHVGMLGQAFLNCSNIAQMLRICQCFQFQLCPFLFVQVSKTTGKTHLIFNSAVGTLHDHQQRFLYEFMFTAMLGALKFRLGELVPLSIKLPYRAVEYTEQYQVHWGGKVQFDQQIAMITIADNWLYKPLPDSSLPLKKMALNEAKVQRLTACKIGFVQAVCQYIKCKMATQDISLEACAAHFKMSPATFKRKLSHHQTRYQQLLDQLRSQHAIFLMTENQQSNERIASSLQFTDLTNFRRAFKRWTGMTPTDFRHKCGQF